MEIGTRFVTRYKELQQYPVGIGSMGLGTVPEPFPPENGYGKANCSGAFMEKILIKSMLNMTGSRDAFL